MARVDVGGRHWRLAAAAGLAGCAIAAVAMAPTWSQLARTWREDAAFQWCWLVVPAVLWGLSQRCRAQGGATDLRFDFRGLLATIPAAVVWWLCGLMNLAVGQELALVVALHGIAWSTLGGRIYRDCFSTLALLFLMVPSADVLQPVLRDVTLHGLDLFASAAGLPHRVEGYEITIAGQHYIVSDECSGLAPATLSMFLGFFFGTLLYRSVWKALSLATVATLLGVAANIARVVAIVWIDWVRGSQMDLTTHADIQWLSVIAVLGLLLVAVGRLHGDRATAPSETSAPMAVRRRHRLAPLLAGLSIPLTVWALDATGHRLAMYSGNANGTAPRTVMAMPATLAGASRVGDAPHWNVDPVQSTAASRTVYRRGDLEIEAFVVTTSSATVKLPRWRLPSTASGHWRDMQTRRQTHCDAQECVAFSRLALQGSESSQRRSMEAAYCGAGAMTDSVLRIRVAHAWDRLRGQADAMRSVVLLVTGEGLSAEEAEEALRALCCRSGEIDAMQCRQIQALAAAHRIRRTRAAAFACFIT